MPVIVPVVSCCANAGMAWPIVILNIATLIMNRMSHPLLTAWRAAGRALWGATRPLLNRQQAQQCIR
jgi:hypothetical protein